MKIVILVGCLLLIALKVSSTSQSNLSAPDQDLSQSLCRDRSGYSDPATFSRVSCANCFAYLFPDITELKAYSIWLVSINGTLFPSPTFLVPDPWNATSRALVCSTLDKQQCDHWSACCTAAKQCCDDQQIHTVVDVTTNRTFSPSCPGTWDGYGCWTSSPAGQDNRALCPAFILHASPTTSVVKHCTINGSWFTHWDTNLEWTDYSGCLRTEGLEWSVYINLGCNIASLVVLVPSVIIFLAYRPLRSQHRIRLHINLFLSFVVISITYILWDLLVVYNRMNTTSQESVIHQNTAGCKFLYVLTRYARSTNYLWMFIEGYYLHRLIANAFEPPKSLIQFYIIGWGLPWIPVSIYSILRAIYADESCWVQHFGGYEWLIYIPNLLCLSMNLIFLTNILRILLTQLQTHPKEPSNFRRAVKAAFVLIPLFGIQLIVILYRPPPSAPGSRYYSIIYALVTNLQGFLVGIILCLLNKEVHSLLRRSYKTWSRGKNMSLDLSKRRFSASTQITLATDNYSAHPSRRASINSNRNYLPLKPVRNGSDDNIIM